MLLLAFATTTAQASPSAKPAPPPPAVSPPPVVDDTLLPFERHVLANGLEVILHRDTTLPVVSVNVWYHVGAFHELAGRAGFAHLFEHLMFQGTPHVGTDGHFAYLESIGASGINGTTSLDRTNYYETVPAHELPLALWLESDRMGWLLEGVTEEKLQEQIGVVKNERLQGTENAPYGLAEEALWQRIFPEGHPYRGQVIGSVAEIESFTLDEVKDFFTTYYAPSNATLTLAGDFEPKEALALVEKYFGTLPAWPKPAPRTLDVPKIEGEQIVLFDETIGRLPLLEIVWLTPSFYAPGDADLDVLANLLTGGKAGRLRRLLVDELRIAQSVRAYQASGGHTSTFHIRVQLLEGQDPKAALAAVDDVLRGLPQRPPSDAEVSRALRAFETERLFGLQDVSARADLLQMYNHYLGTPAGLGRDMGRYRAVTPATVVDALGRYLVPTARAILIAKPLARSKEDS